MGPHTSHPGKDPPEFRLDFSGRDPLARAVLLRSLLDQTSADDHRSRARLESMLAGASSGREPDAAAAAALRASAHATQAQDEESAAWALLAGCVVDLSPRSLDSRLEVSRELLAYARAGTLPELAQVSYFLFLGSLAEAGAINELDLELAVTGPTLAVFPALDAGRHAAWFRCMRATLDGRAAEAERLAAEGLTTARAEADPDAEAVYGAQLTIVRWMQGRASEVEGTFLVGRQLYPGEPVWAAALAWVWLYQGRASAARGLVHSLPPVTDFPRDRNWLAAVAILGDVVAQLREPERALELRALLLPFERRLATIGLGVTFWGTVARPLARLAHALGDTDGAIRHYRTAIDVCAQIGAQAWLAESQWELAQILGSHSDADARDEAVHLATEAAVTGRSLQLHGIEDSAAAVLAEVSAAAEGGEAAGTGSGSGAGSVAGGGAVAGSVAGAVLTRPRPGVQVLGGFRVVAVDGTVARWKSRKARELLKILLARRGAAIERETLMDLLWPDEAPARVANRFGVAATAVRRALDPDRSLDGDAFLDTSGNLVRLHLDRMSVDVEMFLARARTLTAAPLARADERRARLGELREALDLFTGEVLIDEPDALWADRLRREAHLAYFSLAHALGELARDLDDQVTRVEAYRAILTLDGFDQRAHVELVDALVRLGAHGQATEARAAFLARMAELGLGTTSAHG